MPELKRPLAGQVLLITGAISGTGATMVERLALKDARSVIQYGRDK
jgi:3-oxoacyl-[acyl-carrier protein] reductase